MSIVNVSIEELENTSKRFEETNKEFRKYHIAYLKYTDLSEENKNMAVQKMCDLLILHDENPKWSFTKAVNFIAAKNQDITGFSKTNVKRYVTEEIKTLLHVEPRPAKKPKSLPSPLLEQFRQQKGKQKQEQEQQEESETNVQNNVIELKESIPRTLFVPEDSSITSGSNDTTDDDDDSLEETEQQEEQEQEIIIDDPRKIMKQYEDQIIKQNKAYEELEEKYLQVITPYEAKGSVVAPNGQEIPIIGKADPYKRAITFEIDQQEVKKLKRY
jgi:hypothetical protein